MQFDKCDAAFFLVHPFLFCILLMIASRAMDMSTAANDNKSNVLKRKAQHIRKIMCARFFCFPTKHDRHDTPFLMNNNPIFDASRSLLTSQIQRIL